MIQEIFKSIFKNFQTFLVIWVIVILVNQIFIFGACFAPYCLIAALPHTGVIAALITYFSNASNTDISSNQQATYEDISNSIDSIKNKNTFNQPKEDIDLDDFEDMQEPYCPKCGSKMTLRTAKRGKYSGQKFWGCSKYPNCNGILNV